MGNGHCAHVPVEKHAAVVVGIQGRSELFGIVDNDRGILRPAQRDVGVATGKPHHGIAQLAGGQSLPVSRVDGQGLQFFVRIGLFKLMTRLVAVSHGS